MPVTMHELSRTRERNTGDATILAERSRTDSARGRNPILDRSYIVPVLSKAQLSWTFLSGLVARLR